MGTHTVQSAKTHLSRLLQDVESGDDVIIARGKRPIARLVPIDQPGTRTFGVMSFSVPHDFDDALPEDDLAAWE